MAPYSSGPAGIGTAAFRFPAGLLGIGGHCELQIDLFSPDPIYVFFATPPGSALLSANPVPITVGADYGSFTVTIPIAVPPGVTIVVQVVDLSTLVLSPGNEIRF